MKRFLKTMLLFGLMVLLLVSSMPAGLAEMVAADEGVQIEQVEQSEDQLELKAAKKGVTLDKTSATIYKKKTLTLKASFKGIKKTTLKWSSNKTSVASVNSKGKVTAKKAGTATITVKTKDGKYKATCKITVVNAVGKRRAFLIGQKFYSGSTSNILAAYNDLEIMGQMFLKGGYKEVYTAKDLTGQKLYAVLYSLATEYNIGKNDVTTIYYTGHGMSSSTMKYRGALVGTDNTFITVDTIQSLLDRIPGTVVLILDSCLSGQFIQSKGGDPNVTAKTAEEFNRSVINAFQMQSKALPSSSKKSKYQIMTASKPLENSAWSTANYGFPISVYTYYLSVAGGIKMTSSGALSDVTMKADKNNDKKASVQEMHSYTANAVKKAGYKKQNCMRWPTNSSFVLLQR